MPSNNNKNSKPLQEELTNNIPRVDRALVRHNIQLIKLKLMLIEQIYQKLRWEPILRVWWWDRLFRTFQSLINNS
jgi:hypothetical protein